MEIRLAHPNELSDIMAIIDEARKFLAASGSDQWQGVYPDETTIFEDILNGYAYVAIVDNQVAGYVAMLKGFDSAYDHIYDGNWMNPENHDYIYFHRVAVSAKFRGQQVIQTLLEGLIETRNSNDFRADTHPKNLAMQHILVKLGFKEVGKVTYEGERLAYERVSS